MDADFEKDSILHAFGGIFLDFCHFLAKNTRFSILKQNFKVAKNIFRPIYCSGVTSIRLWLPKNNFLKFLDVPRTGQKNNFLLYLT